MKQSLLILVFVSVLIAIVVSLNSKPNFVESSSESSSPAPSRIEVQKNSGKVLSVMPQEYKNEN